MTDLTKLAERVEGGTPDEQASLLEEGAVALRGHSQSRTDPWWGRWDALMSVDAFESAAMTLVPEGWTFWSIQLKRIGTGHEGARAEVSRLSGGDEDYCISRAATPALALAAAALRAKDQADAQEGQG